MFRATTCGLAAPSARRRWRAIYPRNNYRSDTGTAAYLGRAGRPGGRGEKGVVGIYFGGARMFRL